jgi:hypothetical protein
MVHLDAEFINKLFTKVVCEGDLNTMMSYYVDDGLEYSDYGKSYSGLYYATFFSWDNVRLNVNAFLIVRFRILENDIILLFYNLLALLVPPLQTCTK